MTHSNLLAGVVIGFMGLGLTPAANAGGGNVILVPGDAAHIQGGVNQASDGDTVLVGPGVYVGTVNFLGKDILVQSSGGPEATVIDATGFGRAAVVFVGGETAAAQLEGFTIRGGGDSESTGGGMRIFHSSPVILDCRFEGNLARTGGGIDITGDSFPLIRSCLFVSNIGGFGGGIFVHDDSAPQIFNSVFAANVAGLGAAVFANRSQGVEIVNCTVLNNVGDAGGAFVSLNSSVHIANSILWGNTPAEIYGAGTTVTHSNVEGGFAGQGNKNVDPLFADETGRLEAGSPCIDAGANAAVPEGMEADLLGLPRFVDDPETDDTGSGKAPIVDMGAFEFQVASSCTADFNGDGRVATGDLLDLLVAWGECEGCPQDLDGDTFVTFADLLVLIEQWGPCAGE